jgi:3-dehydroquinate dehydratase/shikimate dehydrogenase
MKKSKLCLCLTASSIKQNLIDYENNKNFVDLLELRADFLDKQEIPHIKQFPALVHKPVILTYRRKAEGGMFGGTESERISILKTALGKDFKYIDLEDDFEDHELEKQITRDSVKIIRSLHVFSGVPHDLGKRFNKLARNSRELPKVAVMPRNTGDLVRFIKCIKEFKNREKIALCMGDYGIATRILSVKLGSFLSYCSNSSKKAAPGHFTPALLHDLYGFPTIDDDTAIYGVIGNPVMHTSSPQIHNRGFRLLNLNAVYIPFLVDNVDAFFQLANLLDIRGFSVTIPHKIAVIKHLATRHESVEALGACNTVVKKEKGWYGLNTDVQGFITPLKKRLKGVAWENLKATLIGAGGAARAVIYALIKEGIKVLVLNRTLAKAEKLAQEYNCKWAPLNTDAKQLIAGYNDIIVQTTSMGMEPEVNQDPLAFYKFTGKELVYDIVYKPPVTAFLKRAEKAGCTIIKGSEMLISQALGQFKEFTGRDYPYTEGISL